VARAYRTEGFIVGDSGRVIAPPRPLRPSERPPGLSRLPAPTRKSTTAAPAPLAYTVTSLADVPALARKLYSDDSGAHRLNRPGRLLAGFRAARAKDPLAPAPGGTLTKAEWAVLAAVAEPDGEREALVKAVALQKLKIEG
jgi:hypothetical protein